MKLLKFILITFVFTGLAKEGKGQNNHQTIRGVVVDKITQTPLPGAAIILEGSNPQIVTASDENGIFKISNVPVGKRTLTIKFMGYFPQTLSNLTLNSGKELVLNIEMEENITIAREVVIEGKVEKEKALNELSLVSSRTFSVEETQKFAAAVNDPARMATSFAGVVSGPDGNNIISIRGNSPNGLMWRMEGVEIPNPNHFSNVGSSGGGISILSSQLLSNSDFSTGAFAAEYGNATSGVFDLRLRKGNNEKTEYTFQAGFLGLDAAVEGPIKKGYNGSYLVNYRFSTLSLLSKIGVNIGDASTIFQDLSYNVSLPTEKMGNFSLFGFGGISTQSTVAKKDTNAWKEDSFYQYNSRFYANTGATGITHNYILKGKTLIKSALVFSGTGNGYNQNKLDQNFVGREDYRQDYFNNKITLSTQVNHKFTAKASLRSGVILNRLGFDFLNKFNDEETGEQKTLLDKQGHAFTLQAYSQLSYRINEKLVINPGIHYLVYMGNQSKSIEPRIGAKYSINPNHAISIGYGTHGQVLPLGIYFTELKDEKGNSYKPNQNLSLSRAQHYVLAYDLLPAAFYHLKAEVYYQDLSNIGISNNPVDKTSLINQVDGYTTEALVSSGRGINKGIELTAERFLNNNLYALLSLSLYDSKFKAADGNWYNTRFNGNMALSFTSGKEWALSKKENAKILGVNMKTIYAGGLRETPIKEKESIAAGNAVYDFSRAYEEKLPDYFRTDLRISLKRNYRKATGTVALDIQNVSNRGNVGGRYYDKASGKVKTWKQAPLIPIISYRLEF